jgi:hypothetical protein
MENIAGSGCEPLIPLSERKPLKDIERSIIKTYRREIWSKFHKAVRDFKLVEEGDRIAVGISGGKDSLLMAKLFQELQRHGVSNFELEFIAMDPGFHPSNRELLLNNCQYLAMPYSSAPFTFILYIAVGIVGDGEPVKHTILPDALCQDRTIYPVRFSFSMPFVIKP